MLCSINCYKPQRQDAGVAAGICSRYRVDLTSRLDTVFVIAPGMVQQQVKGVVGRESMDEELVAGEDGIQSTR
jgi:hypothetical protein